MRLPYAALYPPSISRYAPTMHCPVPAQRMILRTRCAVLSQGMRVPAGVSWGHSPPSSSHASLGTITNPPIIIRVSYGLCGTAIVYAATPLLPRFTRYYPLLSS
eukprot:752189-Rhodomonas_salina.2